MNKQDLIKEVFDQGFTRTHLDAERAVEFVLDAIRTNVVEGKKVSLGGFGIFEKKERKGRVGRNPRTGESVDIPSVGVVKFRPAKAFKDAVK